MFFKTKLTVILNHMHQSALFVNGQPIEVIG